ncbi:MAG: AAA family ATPase [Candidatus Adlerbacteria bacterium]|nr:AAA family ATPase [Candidatus Adlerbacteria bacterium]
MNKIVLIGCPGAGKTTLARKLGAKLNIPVHHLDKYFWKENWTPTPQAEFRKIQDELMKEDRWIVDGNFTKSIDNRVTKADTVVFFDFPKTTLVWRYLKRFVQDFNKVRPDMGGDNKASFNPTIIWNHITFVLKFPRNEVYTTLKEHAQDKNVVILRNTKEVATFLDNA